MDISLSPSQLDELTLVAQRSGRTPADLAQEAISLYLNNLKWFDERVEEALQQVANGNLVEEEEMDAHFERILNA